MINRLLYILGTIVILTACSSGLSPIEKIENASQDYKNNRSYVSLETISNSLYAGMLRSEVERLLGTPDYSPIDGQYYYSSDRSANSEDQGRSDVPGLVIDYRDENGNVTDTLHEFWFGTIGE